MHEHKEVQWYPIHQELTATETLIVVASLKEMHPFSACYGFFFQLGQSGH